MGPDITGRVAKRDDDSLCIGYLPGRVRPAMWVEDGTTIVPLAYFCSEEAFDRFKELAGGVRLAVKLENLNQFMGLVGTGTVGGGSDAAA